MRGELVFCADCSGGVDSGGDVLGGDIGGK
jgi:hypothetical protein